MDINHIIEPERQGLWIAAGFIVALFALVLGLAAIQKVDTVLVGTQAQILVLNGKIDGLKGSPLPEKGAQAPQVEPATSTK